MKFSYAKIENSDIDRNDIEYQLSFELSNFSSKFIKIVEEKKENISYEDFKSMEKSEIENISKHNIYLSFKKAVQLLKLLKVEGFDDQSESLDDERFLFTVLFGSETPTYEQLIKRLKFIIDLTRMTIEPFKSCIFRQTLSKDVETYIFKEEYSKLYMVVNVTHGKGIDGEDIKVSEHIYIHKSPSVIIGKWVKQLKNPSVQKEPPLAILLHKYAISIIKPQYIVSHPLSIMDPVFSQLQKENFLKIVPSDSNEFKIIKKNIPFNFFIPGNNHTCEQISVMFKVINIPDLDILDIDNIGDKDCKINVYVKGLTTYALGSKCGETIGDIKKFLKLHPEEELAERDLYISLSDNMLITKDMNLWVIPDCKVEVYVNELTTHMLGSRCGETIGDIKKFLNLKPEEKLGEKNLYTSLSDNMPITKDIKLWVIPKFVVPDVPNLPTFDLLTLLNPSNPSNNPFSFNFPQK